MENKTILCRVRGCATPRLRLVDDWRRAWRWFSVNCMALALVIQSAWAGMPEDMKSAIPSDWVSAVSITAMALGILGRLIKQGDADD